MNLERNFPAQNIEMANRQVNRCSGSLVCREMQIKATMIFHFSPVRWLSSKTQKAINAGDDVGKRYPNPLLVGM